MWRACLCLFKYGVYSYAAILPKATNDQAQAFRNTAVRQSETNVSHCVKHSSSHDCFEMWRLLAETDTAWALLLQSVAPAKVEVCRGSK